MFSSIGSGSGDPYGMTMAQLITDTATALTAIRQQDLPQLQQPQDWQSKYRLLMQLGKKLPPIPEKMRQNEWLVKGCESRAWLLHYYDSRTEQHFFVLDSDARIVKGLLAIMLCFVNGMTRQEISTLDLQRSFDSLNLKPYLSQSRGNGLNAMVNRIKEVVAAH
ncbi:SufE family protein [Alishewanella sp. SMS8]|uniref:SufE family protein n=1 Tax=Alishewanella sp. SMS8 TaxID=2994676 RepID=UPI002741049B|nr:SufE family protein [Alishewanella sp. SMS8]MDP5460275.1 SufE family protein [Alishewanella sp. SMS8]